MANHNPPWNKGLKQPTEVLKEKQRAYYQANRERIIEGVAANRASKPAKYKQYSRWYMIQRKYGLTEEQFKSLELAQNHKCAICKTKAIKVVDHCHSSGKVRGLLCHGCNRDMAIVDRPELLTAAQRYKSESE